jgi:hypothetical protein
MPKNYRRTVLTPEGEEVPMSVDENALEDAREKVHKRGASDADHKKYRDLQEKVAKARQKRREDEGRTGVSVVTSNGEVG